MGGQTVAGVFYDGRTSRRQDVHVELADGLRIVAADARTIAVWPYDELREIKDYGSGLKLTREGGEPLARLELRAGAIEDELRRRSPNLAARGAEEWTLERKAVLWSVAAVVSIVALTLYGVPAIADRVAPLLPWSVDVRMGRTVDAQIRLILPVRPGGFACGEKPEERPGRLALDALAKTLSDAAALPVPIDIVAVRSDIPNALALPGGSVYLFDGLIDRAKDGEEIAGVLAHEIGHVAARDGARRALQAGGVSLLFGFVIGDFVGGGATVAVIRGLSEASYARAVEAAADRYSVGLMGRVGADPKALGELLTRLSGDERRAGRSPLDYLASHPAVADRQKAIDDDAPPGPYKELMTPAEFSALKRICGPKP